MTILTGTRRAAADGRSAVPASRGHDAAAGHWP